MPFFNNPGRKLKLLAVLLALIECAASVIGWLGFLVEGEAALAFAILFGGFLVAWVSNIALYGFGQLIESTESTEARQIEILSALSSINYKLQYIERQNQKTASTTNKNNKQKQSALFSTAAPVPQPVKTEPVTQMVTPNTAQSEAKPSKQTVTPNTAQSQDSEKEKLYVYAVQMFEQRSYNVAYNIFSKIPDYKDSASYLEQLKQLI